MRGASRRLVALSHRRRNSCKRRIEQPDRHRHPPSPLRAPRSPSAGTASLSACPRSDSLSADDPLLHPLQPRSRRTWPVGRARSLSAPNSRALRRFGPDCRRSTRTCPPRCAIGPVKIVSKSFIDLRWHSVPLRLTPAPVPRRSVINVTLVQLVTAASRAVAERQILPARDARLPHPARTNRRVDFTCAVPLDPSRRYPENVVRRRPSQVDDDTRACVLARSDLPRGPASKTIPPLCAPGDCVHPCGGHHRLRFRSIIEFSSWSTVQGRCARGPFAGSPHATIVTAAFTSLRPVRLADRSAPVDRVAE